MPLAGQAQAQQARPTADLNAIWGETVSMWLQRPLWKDSASYTSCHLLMVPLHHAYLTRDPKKIQEFRTHYTELTETWSKDPAVLDPVPLDQLQYLYLAGRFLVLENQCGEKKTWNCLENLIFHRVERFWLQDPAIHWSGKIFKGMRERMAWKLGLETGAKKFWKGINDDELFLFAIVGDLTLILNLRGEKHPPFLDEINACAKRTFEQDSVFRPDGGWLFQPGVWSDHPDNLYAGRNAKAEGLSPASIQDVAWDSSHSHRFPLWIRSLRDASPKSSKDWVFYDRILSGLGRQFVSKVLVSPSVNAPFYRLNNFMDGRNGIYRWNYGHLKMGDGYGPYELSGTFLLGWWGFLPNPEIRSAYLFTAQSWPPSKIALDLYEGPSSGTKPIREFADKASRAVRIRELIIRILAEDGDTFPKFMR